MLNNCVQQTAVQDSTTQNSCWKILVLWRLHYLLHWRKDMQHRACETISQFAKYCSQHVCLSICLSLSAHIS